MSNESTFLADGEGTLSPGQKTWRFRIITSTYFAYAGFYFTRKVFTICKKPIAAQFGWDVGVQPANIWTAFLVAYMVGQFANSYIGRKWGPRVLLLGGLGISIGCNLIFGFANSYPTFLVFMIFNGLMQAAGWPGVVGGIAHWLRPKERGTVMAFWSTNYVIGNIIVKSLGGYMLGKWGWSWSFWGMTVLAFGVWWLVYFWQRNKPEDVGLEPIVRDEGSQSRLVQAAQSRHLTAEQYFELALNPVVLAMGTSYFCVKFLRYELDSWLPTFLGVLGLSSDKASYYSTLFDIFGMGGAVMAGWAMDRWFRGNWALTCLLMSLGMVAGFATVLASGQNPVAVAVCCGFIGFMIYGPDTLISGAAAVQVAGEANGVAVAGVVNGVASLGPVIQEKVVGWLVQGDLEKGMIKTNWLALSMSILCAVLMAVMTWRLKQVQVRKRM